MQMRSFIIGSVMIALAGPAAAQVAVLNGGKSVMIVDPMGKMQPKTLKVTGTDGDLVGIDVRPADKMLYAVDAAGGVYTLDLQSGKATRKSKLETMLGKGVMATIDFNPAADRLRVMGSDGMNLRANVDDGKVIKDGDLKFPNEASRKPGVTAGAYTNSFAGTKETALYDIDGDGRLLKQAPPNDGVLAEVGKIDVKEKITAFDIESDGAGGNTAWAVAGNALYKVDLATAKATKAGELKGVSGTIRDIAVLPRM